MTTGARLYLVLCLFTTAGVLAPEALPRAYRGVAVQDLRRLSRGAFLDRAELDERFAVARGNLAPLENERERIAIRVAELEREGMLRSAQTLLVLHLFAWSVLFFLFNVRRAMRVWRATPSRAGLIEVMETQELAATDEAARKHAQELLASRSAAIRAVYPRVAYRCGYCGTRSRWKTLGRIGKRIVRRQPPRDAKDLGIVLAKGWWYQPEGPVPCVKCGSADLSG